MGETLRFQLMMAAPPVPSLKCFSMSQGKESVMKATHLSCKHCSVIGMFRALNFSCMSILRFQTVGETKGVSRA